VEPCLTREWICNLLVQLLLGLARAVALGSQSRRTHDHIFFVLFETPPTWKARLGELYSVIPPGTGLPFRRFLRFAGLRWRYSNPPPHGPTTSLKSKSKSAKVKVKVILRLTVSRPVCPVVRPPSGPVTNFSFSLKFSLDSYGFVIL
jgi:hypothetical protein